jgi:hypothetical protein
MRAVRRTFCLLAVAVLGVAVQPAQAQQALNISFGYFTVTGEDAREEGDVLVANREILAFDIDDFNTGSIGAEWLFPIGEFLEVGGGVAFTRRTVPSVYDEFVNRDGSEIEQDLRLRVTPITATVRLLPFGRSRAVQPYVGGGIGFFNYRYSEVGDFVDFTDRSVFRDAFVAEGTETGGVALAGIRLPVSDALSLGGEVRWQKAAADLSDDFLGTRLDLGGFHYLATVHVKF